MLNRIIRQLSKLNYTDKIQDKNAMAHQKIGAAPVCPRHDDLYLVSYPKSGATWLDFLVANVNVLMSGDNSEINIFNVHDFVPDIHYSKDIGNIRTSFPAYRIIKSHDNYNPAYKKVIYLVRDPRDVMISYYHFATALGDFSGSLADFIRSPNFGIDAWCNHLQGWFEDSPVALRIYFMRYEDMKNDIFETMTAMYKMLGHQIPKEILTRAIELSSFSKMKESEEAWGYGGRPSGKNLKFMRKGKFGGFKDDLLAEDIEHINSRAAKFMNQFNYTEVN